MDKRLVIPPWKVELVQRYFSKDKESPGRKEKSSSADVSPPPRGDQSKSTSPARLRICRPKLSSKMKKPQGEGKDDVSSSRSKPDSVHSRPKIILDKRKFPVKLMVEDQGLNCVSVLLKPVAGKGLKLSERIRVLKDLSCKYPVKYVGKSQNMNRASARLDFCFQSAADARLFFGKVNNLVRAQQKISVILLAEQSLGRFGLIFLPSLCSIDID